MYGLVQCLNLDNEEIDFGGVCSLYVEEPSEETDIPIIAHVDTKTPKHIARKEDCYGIEEKGKCETCKYSYYGDKPRCAIDNGEIEPTSECSAYERETN